MSIRDQYDQLDKKSRKTVRIIGVFIALVFAAFLVHACSGSANAQLVGRGPEPVHIVALTVKATDGRRIAGTQLGTMPPIGYVFEDNGRRWRIVGGEFGAASCSTTRCGVRVTVTAEPAQ